MNKNLLFSIYRHIVKHRDWLCMKFVTRQELNQMLNQQSITITEAIKSTMADSNRELANLLREHLQTNAKFIPQLTDNSPALRTSLYKYLFHSDQARISFIQDLKSLNDNKMIVLRIDDVNAVSRIELAEVMGGLVSVLRVILRYTSPSYLSMVKDRTTRWNSRQSDERKEFIEFLRQTITVSGRQIDRDSFYHNFKYALNKEGIEPMLFSLA